MFLADVRISLNAKMTKRRTRSGNIPDLWGEFACKTWCGGVLGIWIDCRLFRVLDARDIRSSGCEWIHSKLTVACLFVSRYATWYYCSIFTGFLFGSIANKTNTNDNSYIMNNLPRALWLHTSYPPLPLSILLLNISLEWPTWIGLEYLYGGSEQLSSSSFNVCGTHCD